MIHVDRVAIVPPVAGDPRAIHHFAGVRGDALTVKGGLHEAALPQVKVPLARQQTFAQQHLRALEDVSLHEGALMRHQHIAHVIGMRDEMDVQIPEPRARDVTLLAVEAEQESGEVSCSQISRGRDEAHGGCM